VFLETPGHISLLLSHVSPADTHYDMSLVNVTAINHTNAAMTMVSSYYYFTIMVNY